MRMTIQSRTRERRRRVPHCAHLTHDRTPCHSIPAWRCESCKTVLCGVHIVRNERGALCGVCECNVERFLKRRSDRRCSQGGPDDREMPVRLTQMPLAWKRNAMLLSGHGSIASDALPCTRQTAE